MKLAVIPARGGSKRIPRKNIREFCGKPIIAYSIEAALQSKCFDSVIVSTDDAEIAAVARECGAETPFVRPEELSNDCAGTIPVIKHAIEWFIENGVQPELVCCVYATAPFVTPQDLKRGLELLVSTQCEYAFTVTSYPFPIQRAVKITQSGRLEMFQPEHFNTRSQDLEEAFHDAGQFYWGRSKAFLGELPIFTEDAAPVVLPRHRVQDIDTLEDWYKAELMFKVQQNEMKR
ncbi:pseudaminic acid cytidylyltransferase [Desulforhopalus sp. IMCC35007]|uniref:pseudaminic acid cytidylyltransferase n=1 Tax=Desulforhopalus sp. IMCC35007 TaxID=2569543 RepID=UPI0010AE3F47|nr:pseudaminic acid cytidylyltransferase [Desulforhopalus sp. IMCC35007]TKB05598.1 pseudaminic acid cytidylyltransferase [Desulforhopalus sp. IMCC35007]